jgi:hypothetical protein
MDTKAWRRRRYGWALAVLAVAAVIMGCELDPVIRFAQSMDDVERATEEFGSADMSAPVLASPAAAFNFALSGVNATTFYNDAKQNVQTRVGDFSQSANIMGIGANVAASPMQATAYAAQMAQYQNAVMQNAQAQSLANQKQALLNRAALDEYNLQMQAAQKETDPTQKAADITAAESALSAQFQASGPATLPSYPTATPPTAASSVATTPTDAAALLSSAQGSAFQALLGSSGASPTITDREALFQAAGDNATAAIFNVLGDPGLAKEFADKKVVFGVVTVAVNPGWRSRQGYQADIATEVKYVSADARLDVVKNFINDAQYDLGIRKRVAMTYGLTLPSGDADPYDLSRPIPPEYTPYSDEYLDNQYVQPVVAAVAPMTESNVEQDQNSRRSARQFALDLAAVFTAAGLNVQGSFFDHYAQSLQQDIDQATQNVSVNTYSINGGLFGFEVGPKLRAIGDPTKLQSDPTTILDRQSFPALIIFGFDNNDLRPRVVRDRAGQFRVQELQMEMTTLGTWHPLVGGMPRQQEETRLLELQTLLERRRKLKDAYPTETEREATWQTIEDEVDDLASGARWHPGAAYTRDELDKLERDLTTKATALGKGPELIDYLVSDIERSSNLQGLPESLSDTAIRYLAELITTDNKLTKARRDFQDKMNSGGNAQAAADVARQTDPAPDDPASLQGQINLLNNSISTTNTDISGRSIDAVNELRLYLSADQVSDLQNASTSLSSLASALAERDKDLAQLGDLQEQLKQEQAKQPVHDKKPTDLLTAFGQWLVAKLDVNPPKVAAQKPNQQAIDQESANEQTMDKRVLELCKASQELCGEANNLDGERSKAAIQLNYDAATIRGMAALAYGQEKELRTEQSGGSETGGPTDTLSNEDDSENLRYFAMDRFEKVSYKAFGATLDVPLPVQLVDAGGAKVPAVTSVTNDFVPTLGHRFPSAGESIAIQINGTNLDTIDATVAPTPLTVKRPEPTDSTENPVTILDGPVVTPTAITLHVSLDPTYTQAFGLQFALVGGTGTMTTSPIFVPRLGQETPPTYPMIERITGPVNNPAGQQLDEEKFFLVPPDVIKAKIDEKKLEERERLDLNINTAKK